MSLPRSLALCSLLAFSLPAHSQSLGTLAMPESQRLAAYIEAEYGEYTRDFIHVSLGHLACAYSFVDEQAFNDLADKQLRKMISRGVELIDDAATPESRALSPEARKYAARMAVLTTMEVMANAISAELAPSYGSGEADCALSTEQNQARYQALQAYVQP